MFVKEALSSDLTCSHEMESFKIFQCCFFKARKFKKLGSAIGGRASNGVGRIGHCWAAIRSVGLTIGCCCNCTEVRFYTSLRWLVVVRNNN